MTFVKTSRSIVTFTGILYNSVALIILPSFPTCLFHVVRLKCDLRTHPRNLSISVQIRSVSEGYAAAAFTDSKEALEHFAEMNCYNYYNLVAMDIRMPGLNGLESHYRLTAMNKAIKFLFVSALDSIEELVSVLSSVNYKNVLGRPIEKEYFTNKIKIFQKIILGFAFNRYFHHST